MSQTIRAFIAIDISAAIRQELKTIKAQLKTTIFGKISWVKPENIHLTLKFLGDISEAQLEQIKGIITQVSQANKPFTLTLGKLGAFPSISNPRIIWVAIESEAERTKVIARQLEEKLEAIGWTPEEKKFHPHLTLARVKFIKDKKIFENCRQKINPPSLTTRINEIILFKSTLTPQGAIYTTLFAAKCCA